MFSADDIVLVGKLREDINEKLEIWPKTLVRGFRLRSKTKYMECSFRKKLQINSNTELKMGEQAIPQISCCEYLGPLFKVTEK
jgi:hypothetical protein